ncbi:hypothetical protein V8E36_004278 [Tilletia maclaganii]
MAGRSRRLRDLAPFRNPTESLPKLRPDSTYADLDRALLQLSACYAPALLKLSSGPSQNDSGDDDDDSLYESIDLIRADVNERRFAISWLMKLIALQAHWLQDQGIPDSERDALVERAGQIVAAEAQIDESEAEAILRTFTFPLTFKTGGSNDDLRTISHAATAEVQGTEANGSARSILTVHLRDEPLPPSRNDEKASASVQNGSTSPGPDDRTQSQSYQAAAAVGVQTWAAAAFLSDWLLKDIARLHPALGSVSSASSPFSEQPFRSLELGAGTGLVGLALAKYLDTQHQQQHPGARSEICLTDYHEQVLANLRYNVEANTESNAVSRATSSKTTVEHLDWEEVHLTLTQANTNASRQSRWWSSQPNSWPSITAADCVYSPDHARWLASTMTFFLTTPDVDPHARAVMIMANRTRGRFGEWELRKSVEDAFTVNAPLSPSGRYRLHILERHSLPRVRGLGRDDEDGYVIWLFAFQDQEQQ